ncbi:MAG: amidohydrolase [Firmicutes bacterium]|nr:amidohydrolase [Bacillota bacterium]
MLFKDITIIDENYETKKNMYVGTSGDIIAYISDVMPEESYGEVYSGKGKVLLPAFVNSHSHAAMTLMRGYGENMSLDDWLFSRVFPFEEKLNSEAVYWGTALSMAESIRFGIVSSTDMYYFCEDVVRAVLDAGAKANVSRSISHFTDDDLYDSYRFKETESLYRNFNGAGEGKIIIDMSIHSEYTTTPRAVKQLADFTKEIGANMHVHVSETKKEHEECKERHGGLTPVQYLNSLGAFDTPSVAAHCVWIEGEDYDILKEKGVTVAVNPVSNLKLASGVCNVSALLDRGINVAIGTDSVASNNSLNFIEEMKMFAISTKGTIYDPAVVSPVQTLAAATAGGARAQGRNDCGFIRVGNKADLIVLDIDTPYMRPSHNLITNIVYSASGSDIVMTMCDGRVLYKDGEYLTIDIERTYYETEKNTEAILSQL